MEARNTNSYRMLTTVQALFESTRGDKTWTGIAGLQKAVEDLGTVLTEVATHLEITAAPSGISATKAALLTGMIDLTLEVAAGTHAAAMDGDQGELAAQSDFSETHLRRGREPDIIARCSKVLALATEHLDELADYGVTQAKLTALGKKIDAFQAACPRPRQEVAARAAARKALPKLLRQARQIVTTRIDKLMLQFRKTAPEFYSEYRTARKTVAKSGTQSTGTPEATAQGTTGDMILPKAA
jgi:hypothetical protein